MSARAKLTGHPERWRFLLALAEVGELSAVGYTRKLQEAHELKLGEARRLREEGKTTDLPPAPPGLGTLAYHVRTLKKAGVIEEARTAQRRGSLEHFHRLTEAGAEMMIAELLSEAAALRRRASEMESAAATLQERTS